MVKEGEQGLGSAKGHISSLKEAQEKLLEELDATRARLRETTNLLTALQVRTFLPGRVSHAGRAERKAAT